MGPEKSSSKWIQGGVGCGTVSRQSIPRSGKLMVEKTDVAKLIKSNRPGFHRECCKPTPGKVSCLKLKGGPQKAREVSL